MKAKTKNAKRAQWKMRRTRVAQRIGRSDRTRLVVFRSAKHIYAQLVDPTTGRTITGASTLSPAVREGETAAGKVEVARRVGKIIAELARQHQIEDVVFNRNGFLYHGRVKALAEAARESGLRF
jgi:large subunit ribosomal protein L18